MVSNWLTVVQSFAMISLSLFEYDDFTGASPQATHAYELSTVSTTGALQAMHLIFADRDSRGYRDIIGSISSNLLLHSHTINITS